MAGGSAARIRRAPGRLIAAPSNLSSPTTDYGGTLVGHTKLCALQPLGEPYEVFYEGLGAVGDILEPDERTQFVCFVRDWDDDMVRIAFSGRYASGGTTQHAVYKFPGSITPGESALTRGGVWLYVPDDVVNVDAVLIYNGIAEWQDGAEIAMSRVEEFGMPLAIRCLRDSNDLSYAVGRLADLSLTA